MVALVPLKQTGQITGLFHNPNQGASEIESWSRSTLQLDLEGLAGARHWGATRESCVRVRHIFERGTEIRNERQLSVLSDEELSDVAERLDIPRVAPEWVGANMTVAGIKDFTLLPPSSRIQFPSGATIVVDMQNEPCHLPAAVIEREHPGHGDAFPKIAMFKRGVTAWVQRAGLIAIGDEIKVFVPRQPPYPHL